MPFDGIFLSAVCQSLAPAIGAKVDKVYQPTHHELVLVLRGPSFSGRLLLCADPSARRNICVVEQKLFPVCCWLWWCASAG
jgi:predicted ribosome quality control (RQC) complex YloA/Tae2 family protein